MKEIKLTHNQVTLIDDEDYDRVSQFKWAALKLKTSHKRNVYVAKRTVISDSNNKRTFQLLHRFIVNAPKNMQVDHIDGNPLNNQKHNLRICTPAENARNRPRNVNNTSGYKGVTPENSGFKARIYWQQKSINLGHFKAADEAARAYDAKAKELFGEFAFLNFPEQDDIQFSNQQAARSLI